MNKPEIVAPWGSYNKAMVASIYWADAVYVWVPFTSLRMRQNDLKSFDELKKTIVDLHSNGTKAYLTMNIFPRNIDIMVFEKVVEKISDLGADAIIFSDPWTYNIIKRYIPNISVHLSTQTSVLNTEAIKFRRDLGVKRIVLARELHIREIEQMKKAVPDIELEVFVHGAMCMTYSWRCLMWEYFSWRDGNKWECSHVCRFKYKVYVEEERRPGKLFQMVEDEEWSYLMSSKDLCTIEKLWELLPFVDGLKIEWRSKSEFYVWSCVKAYKHVRDAIINWTQIDESVKNMVYEIPHRYYWDGFLFNELRSMPDWEEKQKDSCKENCSNIDLEESSFCWTWTTSSDLFVGTPVSSITKDMAWPIAESQYFWLILPEYVEKDWEKYYEFIPKNNILVWDEFSFIWSERQWMLSIIWILDWDKRSVDRIHCNMKRCYLRTDWDVNGWECLYKKKNI